MPDGLRAPGTPRISLAAQADGVMQMRGWAGWRRGMAVMTVALVAGAGLTIVAAQADVVWPPNATEIVGSEPDALSAHVASLGGNGEAVAVWDTDSCSCTGDKVQASTFDGTSW